MAHLLLYSACVAVAVYQLSRVRRLWAFVLLFVALAPKIAIAAVPGNTTPLRIDDIVVGAALAMWFFGARPARGADDQTPPPSPATFFLALYWGAAAVSTLVGMAALTTTPVTGLLHAGRLVEYGLLYFFFYSAIAPQDLDRFVEVASMLIGCQRWRSIP